MGYVCIGGYTDSSLTLRKQPPQGQALPGVGCVCWGAYWPSDALRAPLSLSGRSPPQGPGSAVPVSDADRCPAGEKGEGWSRAAAPFAIFRIAGSGETSPPGPSSQDSWRERRIQTHTVREEQEKIETGRDVPREKHCFLGPELPPRTSYVSK